MPSTLQPATPPTVASPAQSGQLSGAGQSKRPPLQIFQPLDEHEPIYTRRVDRDTDDWFDALEKQLESFKGELSDPDCDENFWNREKLAVEEALDFLRQAVAPIDDAIRNYENTRHTIIVSFGEKLRQRIPGTNLPEFLIRDDPQGYLRW